mmetsp:Transcript_9007/g.25871  ORF Transcript_9007/g.25871 Transcript_9007/m.25871 type:complete len:242 (-) Transcript_9007:115-840(-)
MASASSFIACLNSSTSVLRISKRSARCLRVSLMSSLRTEISSSKRFASSSRRSMVLPALSMCALRSSMSFVFLPSAFWQRSRCSMSSCSSLRKFAIIWSMEAMTLSKCPPERMATASCAKPKLWYRWAKFANCALRTDCSKPARFGVALIWMKVVVEAWKVFRASGLVKISIAFPTPISSSVRRRVRSLHSSAFFWHPTFTSSNNFSSAANCFLASSKSSSVSASRWFFCARSNSCCCNVA